MVAQAVGIAGCSSPGIPATEKDIDHDQQQAGARPCRRSAGGRSARSGVPAEIHLRRRAAQPEIPANAARRFPVLWRPAAALTHSLQRTSAMTATATAAANQAAPD